MQGTWRQRSLAVATAIGLVGAVFDSGTAGQGPSSDPYPTFTVGTASASRGRTATGAIRVPAGVDAATDIPVAVVHGSRPGPVLSIVAGAHGTEYASIVAVERLIGRLDPSTVAGTVILVPLVNVASFEQKVAHVNPVDGKNMNRFYPGNPDGTQTERASWQITQRVVGPADYLIDMHGGDLDESLRPFTYWTPTGRADQDDVSKRMALAFGLDHIVISRDRPTDASASRYLENTATLRGKASITVEAGHAGTVEPGDILALVEGTLSVMRALRMLEGTPDSVEAPIWLEPMVSVESGATGLFYPLVGRGHYVAKGTPLGYVTDYLGRRIFEARSPVDGVVLYIRAVPSMTKGETVAGIGVVTRR